jgi:hypothetical protein
MSMMRNVETTLISNEFQPKGNNDIMQCVTCNKSCLFAPRLKVSWKQRKKLQLFLKQKTLIFFYMKSRHDNMAMQLELHWNSKSIEFVFNWIEFKFNFKKMGCQMVEKVLKICLWIWCWKKKLKKTHLSMLLRNGLLNRFKFGIVQVITNNLWNIKFSYTNSNE